MGLKAGIVGLPNVGKSTLFNAITKKNILAANYPFATIEPNVGVVIVPDERLDKLTEIYNPQRTIPTAYEFTDIAGLVKGASDGEGLGNKFLSHIREVDAIVEVVRCFEDSNIIHVENFVDPVRDIDIINVELSLSDLEIINSRIDKIKKKAETNKDKEALSEYSILCKAKDALEDWFDKTRKATWTCCADMKKTFNSVDNVGNQHYVFNIKGNDYRLVVVVKFTIAQVLIRFVGTHKEYDKISNINSI